MQTVIHRKTHEDNQRENFDGADGPLHDLSEKFFDNFSERKLGVALKTPSDNNLWYNMV